MRRALTFRCSTVSAPERPRYLDRLRARRSFFRDANCRFWVFEETERQGAFVEFIEAADPDTLAAAVARAPDGGQQDARVFAEVELD